MRAIHWITLAGAVVAATASGCCTLLLGLSGRPNLNRYRVPRGWKPQPRRIH